MIQFLAILAVIFFPKLVTHYKDDVVTVDPDSVTIEMPSFGGSVDDPFNLDFGGGDGGADDPFALPNFGDSPSDSGSNGDSLNLDEPPSLNFN
nr:hypothetical protein [Marinicella sp. W31]MDC2875785.1 hypothetical protein [Marinicella sp. W31]